MSDKNIIVVSGASSGIGLKTVHKLQKDPRNILICASRKIEQTSRAKLGFSEDNTVLKNINVANENSVKAFFNYIENNYPKLDSIINCAGYVEPKGLFEMTLKNWKETLDVNLTGTFNVTKFGCFLMKESGGKLINIASTAGMTARPGWSAYAAAKSGVINFSLTMAEELKSYGIKVFVICPGRTATPLRRILAPNEDPQTIMQPEAVADVICSLLENKMDVLEGQPIMVRERF